MTSRRAGWLTGLVVFAAMAVLEGVVWIARNATDDGESVSGGELVLSLALRVATFVTVGTAFALAAAVVVWWIVRSAVGRDGAERVLALETTGLHGSRDRWGAARRAELASLDDPVQRGRFSRSAAALAFRHGTGMWPAVLAVLTGAGAGVVVFSAARISFDNPRDRGIIAEPIMGLVVLLLVVAVIAGTLIGRSFRAGLETAVLAWLAIYVALRVARRFGMLRDTEVPPSRG